MRLKNFTNSVRMRTSQCMASSGVRLKDRLANVNKTLISGSGTGSSMDYAILLKPGLGSGHGGIMFGRPKEKTKLEYTGPGPGYYQPKYVTLSNTSGVVFGTEERKIGSKFIQTDERNFLSEFSLKSSYEKGSSSIKNSNKPTFGITRRDNFQRIISHTPGPGYYAYKEDPIRPAASTYTISLADVYRKSRTKDEENSLDITEPKSSLQINTNFQRFSNISRFVDKSGKRRFIYNRILFNSKRERKSFEIIQKNISLLPKETKEAKIKRILEKNAELREKIAATQQNKEKLEENTIKEIVNEQQILERKRLITKERGSKNRIKSNWLELITSLEFMKVLANKYNRKRRVCKRTAYFMRVLFVILWAVGKLIKLRRKVCDKRAKRILTRIAHRKKLKWTLNLRIRSKQRIVKFTSKYEENPQLLLFVKFVVMKITKIQKWFRRIYTQKRMIFAIMNYQWSIIEYAVLKARGMKKSEKLKILGNIKILLKQRKTSEIVPLPVRMFYIKKALRNLNAKFYDESSDCWKLYKETYEKAFQENENQNIVNMLKGLPKVPFVFDKKLLPKCRVFLKMSEMTDIVNLAFVERIKWEPIIRKNSHS